MMIIMGISTAICEKILSNYNKKYHTSLNQWNMDTLIHKNQKIVYGRPQDQWERKKLFNKCY